MGFQHCKHISEQGFSIFIYKNTFHAVCFNIFSPLASAFVFTSILVVIMFLYSPKCTLSLAIVKYIENNYLVKLVLNDEPMSIIFQKFRILWQQTPLRPILILIQFHLYTSYWAHTTINSPNLSSLFILFYSIICCSEIQKFFQFLLQVKFEQVF